jgi:hypothetical protein
VSFVKRFSTKLCFKSSVGFIDQCSFAYRRKWRKKERICVRWFSVPYHLAMQGVKLNHASRGFCLDPAWGRVLKAGWSIEPPVVRVAWQSMLQQAQHVYSRLWCNHMLSAHVGYQQLDSMLRPLSIKPNTCKAREVGSNSYQCVEKGGKMR